MYVYPISEFVNVRFSSPYPAAAKAGLFPYAFISKSASGDIPSASNPSRKVL